MAALLWDAASESQSADENPPGKQSCEATWPSAGAHERDRSRSCGRRGATQLQPRPTQLQLRPMQPQPQLQPDASLETTRIDDPPHARPAKAAQPPARADERAQPPPRASAASVASQLAPSARGGGAAKSTQPIASAASSSQTSARESAQLARPPARSTSEERRVAKWKDAVFDAELLLHQAVEDFPANISVMLPAIDIDLSAVVTRVRDLASRAVSLGLNFYIGSTTCPKWRWEGGWYYPSGPDGQTISREEWMPGHGLTWDMMHVIGSWPDNETAAMETKAIEVGMQTAGRLSNGGLCENIVVDARGLPRRGRYNYAFVYFVCDFK